MQENLSRELCDLTFIRIQAAENAFFVYEAYRDEKAFEEHQKNPPYKRWESEIEPEMVTEFQPLFRGDSVCSLANYFAQ